MFFKTFFTLNPQVGYEIVEKEHPSASLRVLG